MAGRVARPAPRRSEPRLAAAPRYSALLEINTRVYVNELGRQLGRPATLDDIPDAELDQFAASGFDWIWFLSVWETSSQSREVSRTHADWRKAFQATLADLTDDDIIGSGFAITSYSVNPALGGDAALTRLRYRMARRGLRLMLDFVPNHAGLGHPDLTSSPNYFVPEPPTNGSSGPSPTHRWAHGRDPHFPGWPDTLQLNHADAALQQKLIRELMQIATRCDGVRCDMAMLVLPEIFERTWGLKIEPFWTRAIQAVRDRHPDFCFLAEVYWDLGYALQQEGFDYTYDKRLYERLLERGARPIREHLAAGLDYQTHLARFLENHDEPRIASQLPDDVHRAAAVINYFSPGLRFFHRGQFQGRRVQISPHLGRGPVEPDNPELAAFYDQLLTAIKQDPVRNGDWQLLECRSAWENNNSHESFIASAWTSDRGGRRLVAVNYSGGRSQCFVRWPWGEDEWKNVRLTDQLGSHVYERDGNELNNRGLYLDMPAWNYHVFQVEQT